MRVALLLVLGFLGFIWVDAAHADYGEGVLALRCDSKLRNFEIEPRIVWNEELEVLQPIFDRASGKATLDGYEIHSAKKSQSLGGACKVGRKTVSARIVDRLYEPTLELYEDKELVLSILIDDVWQFYGYVFRVRFRKAAGWEQMCGREKSSMDWQPLDTSRKDTNCRSVIP
ncbi:MAG: hypothetical protein IPP28_11475 [Xanthomonadales bacterium]|nr:hypothetical protein [Xanthomonadales bacterium]